MESHRQPWYLGKHLEARVAGICDLLGNPMSGEATWRFKVMESPPSKRCTKLPDPRVAHTSKALVNSQPLLRSEKQPSCHMIGHDDRSPTTR